MEEATRQAASAVDPLTSGSYPPAPSPSWKRWPIWIDPLLLLFLLTALALGAYRYPTAVGIAVTVFVVSLALTAARIDMATGRIPNALTYPTLIISFLSVLILKPEALGSALLGALIAAGPLLLAATACKGAIGMGDVKLMAVAGFVLGVPASGTALVTGIVAGGLFATVGLLTGRLRRRQVFPFGPFLAFGIVYAFLQVGSIFAGR